MKDKINGKLSSKQIKIIYIIVTVIVVLCAYFFVFRTNMDNVSEKEDQTTQLNRQINSIEALQPQLVKLETTVPVAKEQMNQFVNKFQPILTQEHVLFNIYDMSVDSEVGINSVAPGAISTFFTKGKVALVTNNASQKISEELTNGTFDKNKQTAIANATQELVKKEDISQMVGRVTTYQLSFTGTYDHIMDALDWISKNSSENMSLGSSSLTFDSSSGKVTCQCAVNFFSLAGNGVTYKAPKTSDFSFGIKKIFGASQK